MESRAFLLTRRSLETSPNKGARDIASSLFHVLSHLPQGLVFLSYCIAPRPCFLALSHRPKALFSCPITSAPSTLFSCPLVSAPRPCFLVLSHLPQAPKGDVKRQHRYISKASSIMKFSIYIYQIIICTLLQSPLGD